MSQITTLNLEDYIQEQYKNNTDMVVRLNDGSIIFVDEKALDKNKMSAEGNPVKNFGVRYRVMSDDMKSVTAQYLIPNEVLNLAKTRGKEFAGIKLPVGTLWNDQTPKFGVWLKIYPNFQQIGTNDRGEIVLRDRKDFQPMTGAVINSNNTIIMGRAERLVTRLSKTDADIDCAEADAWLKAFELLDDTATLTRDYLCAGIQYRHEGNAPYLNLTTDVNFFDLDDKEMLDLRKIIQSRFDKIGRSIPNVKIRSVINLPKTEEDFNSILSKLKEKGTSAKELGLPESYSDSRFYDPKKNTVSSSNFVLFVPLAELPDEITITTINTDYHGEVKSRGVLSPLMAILSLVDVISAHAGSGVLSQNGTATTFTGPTGTGKTTATSFFAEKNEKFRRQELRRRYEIILKKQHPDLSDSDFQAKVDEVVAGVGIMCQEDWIEISENDNGTWSFWPTEKSLYARTGGFPGLDFILIENEPMLENALADFGASGCKKYLGKVTHEFFPERIFYEPKWGHLLYDRSVRPISAHVFLERNADLDFFAKQVNAKEAVEYLLVGRTPSGKYEPMYNAYPDFSGFLMEHGIIGPKLVEAYAKAKAGDYSVIGNGDASTGKAVFEKLDKQLQLWEKSCEVTPAFIVNGAPGLFITQDVNWLLSEMPDIFDNWKHVTLDDYKTFMEKEFGVTYGPKGEWTHIEY